MIDPAVQFLNIMAQYIRKVDYRVEVQRSPAVGKLSPAHNGHTTANKNGDNDSSNGRRAEPPNAAALSSEA